MSPNRLADETSPYLLQHKDNPVDWYPWGPEALARAAAEDKPIFLSVGYAACHWCHVMEHESFEDATTAAAMNARFVSIKVDREERPDVDGIYMDAVQAMTGHGGWPMTVFCSPDGEPFYAGTYFPKEPRHGMPSLAQVLEGVSRAWQEQRADLLTQARGIVTRLAEQAAASAPQAPLTDTILENAFAKLAQAFDPEWGGFGSAPKFPAAMALEFCLRAHLRGWAGAEEIVRTTLDRMAEGGIHDQLGGGFHRYAVDNIWHVPHFEKMLYDNALLARTYLHGYQALGDERYRDVTCNTLDYLLREMQHADGGFFSSQDADSEGTEGAFFVWSWEELVDVVGPTAASFLGAEPAGNWEGTNVLWMPFSIEEAAPRLDTTAEVLADTITAARVTLFEMRGKRIRPATDDKILAAWNGMAIIALAEAGRALERPDYIEAAARAAEFVLRELRDPGGRLLRSWREGVTGGLGFADDHALMAQACLTLFETTGDATWFASARSLADDLLRLFEDPDNGGFFQTGIDHERLVIRPKELLDNATPSGNSVAATLLQRLALFTGDADYERAGLAALQPALEAMQRFPTGMGEALCALDLHRARADEVAIVGPHDDPKTRALVRVLHQGFLPHVVLAIGDGAATDRHVVPLLEERWLVEGAPAAYVCHGSICEQPLTTVDALSAALEVPDVG